jgi:hypothetical protein
LIDTHWVVPDRYPSGITGKNKGAGFMINRKASFRRKTLYIKNEEWESIHQSYKANDNTSKHNPKEKTKANNRQKQIR